MLRRLEQLTDHDIRNARAINVFIEDEGSTTQLLIPPSSANGLKEDSDAHSVKVDLCIEVKSRTDLTQVQNRVQKVMSQFIE